jgi:glycosyltransferase involved in cell wall biosynthesis
VVSLRGSDVPGYDPRLSFLHRAMLPLTRRIWSNAARVVANSEGLRQLALSCVPRQRIEVIRNGVDLPAVDEHSSRHDHSTRILVVSRLIERKGTDVLLRALARLNDPSVSVDIAGDGPDRHRLEHLARIEGVADRVRFHGFTERTALASLYRHADIFVLTSLAESCSMALLDAMAAGLPVVATAVGGTPELVAHGVNGLLVRPQDADDLAGSLGTLTRDGAQRLRMGMLGRERAVSRHSWRSVALQYEAVFHDAIENHRRARAPANTATAHFSAAPVRRD